MNFLQCSESIYKWRSNFLLLGHSCLGRSIYANTNIFFRRKLSRWISRISKPHRERNSSPLFNFLCHPESGTTLIPRRRVFYRSITFDIAISLVFLSYDAKKSCYFLTHHRGTFFHIKLIIDNSKFLSLEMPRKTTTRCNASIERSNEKFINPPERDFLN